jgi:ABC-2 type transport system ATP-binding protein
MDGDVSGPAIQVEGLGHRYGERWAVRGLSFEAAYGEVLGFLGPNGAGKTTTVKMLTGLLAPSEGRAIVDGIDVAGGGAGLGARIGVTFEQQNLYERLTVRENLVFFGRLLGLPGRRVDEVLEEAAIADRAGDFVSVLSKGLRQRLMLARALLGRPRVLFLDEPTSGLDPQAARAVRDWIRRLAEGGTAVLLTTHDMEEAAELSARVAIIDRGALVALEPPRSLIDRVHPPRLRARLRRGSAIEEVVLPLNANDAARALARLADEGEIVEVREDRASLADVFLSLTGHSLEP